jgi:hypothetical protein
VRQLKQTHPDWGAVKVAQALGLTLDHAKVHLARWIGAQNYAGAIPAPAVAATTETLELPPTHDNELQDNMHDGERDLSYRGTRIQTLPDAEIARRSGRFLASVRNKRVQLGGARVVPKR